MKVVAMIADEEEKIVSISPSFLHTASLYSGHSELTFLLNLIDLLQVVEVGLSVSHNHQIRSKRGKRRKSAKEMSVHHSCSVHGEFLMRLK